MKNKLFLLISLLLGSSSLLLAAEFSPGVVVVLEAEGNVVAVETATQKTESLAQGSVLQEGYTVKTGGDSTAILLFSHGTLLSVEPDTEFAITTFQQTPFKLDETQGLKLEAEPSISITKLAISAGNIVADVAKLSTSSHFHITSSAGVVKVKGTIVSITITSKNGKTETVVLDLPEGKIDFESLDGKTLALSSNQTITFNLAGGTLTESDITPMSSGAATKYQALVNRAVEKSLASEVLKTLNLSNRENLQLNRVNKQISNQPIPDTTLLPTPTPTPTPVPPYDA